MLWLQNLKNNIDFSIRRTFRLSRPNYSEIADNCAQLFDEDMRLRQKELELFQRHPHIKRLQENCSESRYRENLNLLLELDTLWNGALSPTRHDGSNEYRCLEIGVKNWSTLPAISNFISSVSPIGTHVYLTGIELDCWRVYANGHSRWDAIDYHLKQAQKHQEPKLELEVIDGDFLQHTPEQPYHLIVCVLPFVFKEPHLAWGLPTNYFKPEQFFRHMLSSKLLADGGRIILINQGETEFMEQETLLKPLTPNVLIKKPLFSHFREHQYQRYGWLLEETSSLSIQPKSKGLGEETSSLYSFSSL